MDDITENFVKESICRKNSWKEVYGWMDKIITKERNYYLLMGRKQQSVQWAMQRIKA